jgi:hypothetical protein
MNNEQPSVTCSPADIIKDKSNKLAMFEKLTSHQVNPANDLLEIIAADDHGSGGAHHEYLLYWPDKNSNLRTARISFQNGPIKESGVNGVTHEALLAIVRHRLEHYQSGPFACEENGKALEAVVAAQTALLSRTIARMNRGVEGTHQK